MLRAMARSYLPPAFGKSAGARVTVMRRVGKSRPEFIMALLTLSFLTLFNGSFWKANYRKCGKTI